MADTDKQEELMRRYLLGEATAEEEMSIETRFFSDDNYFEQMVFLEEQLVDSYVTGRLSREECLNFERNSTSQQRAKISFVRALVEACMTNKEDLLAIPLKTQSLAGRSRNRFFFRYAAVAAVFTLIVGSSSWLIFTRTFGARLNALRVTVIELQKSEAALNETRRALAWAGEELESERNRRIEAENQLSSRTQLRSDSADAMTIALTLDRGTRGGGSSTSISRVPSSVRWLQFYIDVPASGYESYRVEIRRPGEGTVFNQAGIIRHKNERQIRIRVKSETLSPDDYILLLAAQAPGKEVETRVAEYSFRVSAVD
ncbi:MAG: hypothetical protein DMF61_14820 [Blastocatellia bacterium AA13]|nr:MAG: hypothetical protein DMF61_14820 [Blastocatellia bacterium AA13]